MKVHCPDFRVLIVPTLVQLFANLRKAFPAAVEEMPTNVTSGLSRRPKTLRGATTTPRPLL